ncbi:hypothetical protein DPMN_007401 [Dreissena polymorpha]|uniref:Uncharacterized protein n=1 Tax=Dreissena polymorpha TaxID=45954 RepID=A0A9D4MXA6_DREPO|nr:hypothetical protein DPMN_007401 [Dreissena polymorpha]
MTEGGARRDTPGFHRQENKLSIKPVILYASEKWGTPNINSSTVRKTNYPSNLSSCMQFYCKENKLSIKPVILYASEIWGTPNITSSTVRKTNYPSNLSSCMQVRYGELQTSIVLL